MRLHTKKDCVSSQTSQATLQIGLSPKFLCLCIEVVEGLDGFFKLLLIELKTHKGFKLFFMVKMLNLLLLLYFWHQVSSYDVSTYPWLKFGGELGLELADCSWAVVSLNEHLWGDGRMLEILQAVGLETKATVRLTFKSFKLCHVFPFYNFLVP